MSQETVFGRVALCTHIKVQKADGSMRYYKVVDDENVEITAEQYFSEGGSDG